MLKLILCLMFISTAFGADESPPPPTRPLPQVPSNVAIKTLQAARQGQLNRGGIKNLDELTKNYIPDKFNANQISTFLKEKKLITPNGILTPDKNFFLAVEPYTVQIVTGRPSHIAKNIEFSGKVDVIDGKLVAHYTYFWMTSKYPFTITFNHNTMGFVPLLEDLLGPNNPFENPEKPIKDTVWFYILTQRAFFEDTYEKSQQRLNNNVKLLLFLTYQSNNGSIFWSPPKIQKPFVTMYAFGQFLKTKPDLTDAQIQLLQEWCQFNKPIDFKDPHLLNFSLSDRKALLDAFKDVLWIEYFYAQGLPIPGLGEDVGKAMYEQLLQTVWAPLLAQKQINASEIPSDLDKYPGLGMELMDNKLVYAFNL